MAKLTVSEGQVLKYNIYRKKKIKDKKNKKKKKKEERKKEGTKGHHGKYGMCDKTNLRAAFLNQANT